MLKVDDVHAGSFAINVRSHVMRKMARLVAEMEVCGDQRGQGEAVAIAISRCRRVVGRWEVRSGR